MASPILYLVPADFDFTQFELIEPRFLNWDKSFVSGIHSPLFRVKHFLHTQRKTLILTRVHFLEQALGPPGHVHGGATAGLIDETMGIAVWHQSLMCVTQKLEVHYSKMLKLQEEAFVFTEIVATHEKTVEVHATIYGNEKTPHVSAQGVFHRLRPEQLNKLKALDVGFSK